MAGVLDDRGWSHMSINPTSGTPNVTELVFELVNCALAEIIVLVGGAIPSAVPFRQPVLGSLLGSAAGIHYSN